MISSAGLEHEATNFGVDGSNPSSSTVYFYKFYKMVALIEGLDSLDEIAYFVDNFLDDNYIVL